jgi:tRNA-dihydrouridine synthase B
VNFCFTAPAEFSNGGPRTIRGHFLNIFAKMGMPERPIILAPLAGVSDHPFRRVCAARGADLTYVEMLSAAAISFRSKRTIEMCERHSTEMILGVQLTSRTPEEMGEAVAFLDDMNFDTIDINMGCPVKKVVKSGCGSAILRDPKRVYETTLAARKRTKKPLSVKIRLGWSKEELTYLEVSKAAEEAGADWITVHGRTRNDDYSEAVDLEKIAEIVSMLKIPVIGNGNLFSKNDAEIMQRMSGCAGFMVSRGALGNPWIFSEIKGLLSSLSLKEWLEGVLTHLNFHNQAYGNSSASATCMRKHLLWYISGWPGARKLRDEIVRCQDLDLAKRLLVDFASDLERQGFTRRIPVQFENEGRFAWDPKFEMDRSLDRGVGEDGIDAV